MLLLSVYKKIRLEDATLGLESTTAKEWVMGAHDNDSKWKRQNARNAFGVQELAVRQTKGRWVNPFVSRNPKENFPFTRHTILRKCTRMGRRTCLLWHRFFA